MSRVHLQTILFLSVLFLPVLFLASPLHAQVLGDMPVAIDVFSHEPNRRTFAKPLPLGNAQTLYFERDGDQPRVWRLDWQSNTAIPSLLAGLTLHDDKLRYSAVQTTAGLWLIGPLVVLQKTDGTTLTLPAFGADEPTVAPLPDGSVLVLGNGLHNHTEQLRRLVPGPQGIAVENKGQLPHYLSGQDVNYQARYGVAALALADGRVFTAGGGSTGDTQRAAIVDPHSGAVQAVADMPHKRTFALLLSLPDGRVVVAGHEHLNCYDPGARTVDVYVPQQNAWQSLPDLPFPLCADAYNADGPGGVVLPDGTLVFGGSLEQHLLLLRPQTTAPTGYAPFWTVVGPTERMRISAVLQALSKSEVVLAGGVHHLDFGGCCYGTPGGERVRLAVEPAPYASVNLPLQGTGVARRGDRVFIAAGRVFSFTSTGQLRYSSVAELLDLRSGRVQQLPSLPFVSGAAQVVWLDDERVLVKGRFADHARQGFMPGDNLSSYIPPSSGAMAVFHVPQQRWETPLDNEQIKEAMLLDAQGDEAFLLGSNATLYRVQWSTQQVSTLSSPTAVQAGLLTTDLTGRRLADGRVVVAGGTMQRSRISLLNDECEAATDNPERDCPEQFTGWGPLLPAVRYQWYTPAAAGSSAAPWQQSAAAPDAELAATEVLQTLVDAQGRVLRLVRPASSEGSQPASAWWLERSSSDGKTWQRLPLPAGITTNNSNQASVVCAQGCRLQLATDPRQPATELLFLREGALEGDYASQRFDRDQYHTDAALSVPLQVWWLDETASSPQWQVVLQADADVMRRQPLPLTGALAGIRSLGWHLPQPLLWTASVVVDSQIVQGGR